jgi:hypothetical protein
VSEYEIADKERALDGDQVARLARPASAFCWTQDYCITEQHPTRLGYRIGSRVLDGEGAISANYQHPLPRLLRGGQPTYTHIPPRCYEVRIQDVMLDKLYISISLLAYLGIHSARCHAFATTTTTTMLRP